MNLRYLHFLVTLSLLIVGSEVYAQEATPGDACSTQGEIMISGGPEIAGNYIMICNGSTWQNVDILSNATSAVLDVASETESCAPGLTGTVRYNSTTKILERCYGINWCAWGASGQYDCGWQRKAELTLSSASVTDDMADFPLFLALDNLPQEMFDSDGLYPAKEGGGDIRFSLDVDGDVPLAAEVVNFSIDPDPSLGSAEIYVKIPSVSTTVDTTFYVWWSAPGVNLQPPASSQYGKNSVWDNAYAAVWHMNEDPNGDVADVVLDSGRGNHHSTPVGSMTSDDLVAGILGNAIEFDGSDDTLRPDAPDPGFLHDEFITMTYCGLVTIDSGIQRPAAFFKQGGSTNGAVIGYRNNTDKFVFASVEDDYDTNIEIASSTSFSEDNSVWHYVCGVFDTGNMRLYVNNVLENSSNAQDVKIEAHTTQPALGGVYSNNERTPFGWGTKRWKGKLDEVRISSNPRSIEWITMEYNNFTSPASFVTAGTPTAP